MWHLRRKKAAVEAEEARRVGPESELEPSSAFGEDDESDGFPSPVRPSAAPSPPASPRPGLALAPALCSPRPGGLALTPPPAEAAAPPAAKEAPPGPLLYLVLVSLHGLVRGTEMELGRDADTGGQARGLAAAQAPRARA